MKKMKCILTFLTLILSVNVFAQTPFPSGIRFPNLKEVSSADSIPVIGANGVLKGFIQKDSIGAAKNLQEVTDVGYTTTNPIETSSYLQSGEYIEVPNSHKYFDVLKTSDGQGLITLLDSTYHSGALKYLVNNSLYIGWNAGANSMTDYSNGFGHSSLQTNTGDRSTGFGYSSLQYNKGTHSNGVGMSSLSSNRGNFSNGFGNEALFNNNGNYSNSFGHQGLYRNRGNYVNGFGNQNLMQNLGDNSSGFGYETLQYNDRNNNTALGHQAFGSFYDDVANKKDVLPENVSLGTQNITVTNHGFRPNNGYINLRYTTTGAPITGLVNNSVYQFQVLNSNTIAGAGRITTQGTGIHTFTPQYQYTNSTTIGANSQPSGSNQITLGDSNVTEIDTYGRYRSRAYGEGNVTGTGTPTYNIATDADGNFVETPMSGGDSYIFYHEFGTLGGGGALIGDLDGGMILYVDYPDNEGSEIIIGGENRFLLLESQDVEIVSHQDLWLYGEDAIKLNGDKLQVAMRNIELELFGGGWVEGPATYSLGVTALGKLVEIPLQPELFSRTQNGTVPAPNGSTTNRVLHEDGLWKVPAGGSTQKDYKIISTDTYTLLPEDNGTVLLFTYFEDNGGWIEGEIFLNISNSLPDNYDVEVHSANGANLNIDASYDPLVDFGPQPDASIELLNFYGGNRGQGRVIKLTGNRIYTTGFEWTTGG